MTNYEKIKSMSAEEMAAVIYEYGYPYICALILCKYCNRKECNDKTKDTCKYYVKKWLESEVTDND